MSTYLPAILVIALLYGLLGLGLNLEWGHTGIINFGHVAFFAVGAYTSALLTVHAKVPVAVGPLAAVVAAALFALPIGWITLRLSTDFLAIVTIGFAETIRIILLNAGWSGGPSGITAVPRPLTDLSSQQFNVYWALAVLVVVVLTIWLLRNISSSSYGRLLMAIKNDERAVSMLGRNIASAKTSSLIIGSALAGLAGSIYAHYIGYVAPDQFQPSVTFFVWAGIIIGGSSHLGALLGSVALVALLEASRFLGDFGFTLFSTTQMANVRFIVVGILIVVFLIVRPDGALPFRAGRHGAGLPPAGSGPDSGGTDPGAGPAAGPTPDDAPLPVTGRGSS